VARGSRTAARTTTRTQAATAGWTATGLVPTLGRLRELSLVLFMFGTAFALVALADWRVGDPTWASPRGEAENLTGPVGAVLADVLYLWLGYGAWALLMPFGAAALHLAGRPTLSFLRWIGAIALWFSAIVFLGLVAPGVEPHEVGGLVGRWTADALVAAIGVGGAVLALSALSVSSGTLLFRVRWGRVFAAAADRLEAWWPIVRRRLGRAAVATGAVGVAGAKAAWAGGGVAGAHVGSLARGAGAWSWRAIAGSGARMLQSLTRRAPAEVAAEPVWEDSSIDDEDGIDASSVPPSEVDDRTAVGAGRVRLAEIEWDRTSMAASVAEPARAVFRGVQERPSRVSASAAPARVVALGDATLSPSDVDAEPLSDPESEASAPVAASAAYDVPEVLEAPAPRRVAAAAQPAPTAPKAPAPNAASVVVHRADHLNVRVSDDGGVVAASRVFELPRLGLLDDVPEQRAVFDRDDLQRLASAIEAKLAHFKIEGRITEVRPGPVVTIFEFDPAPGVKVSRIAGLADDLAMALKAVSVRVVAPIPGRGVVGIEIPSLKRLTIYLREVLACADFRDGNRTLPVVLGKDVNGKPVVADLADMPHLLVGGTTGSGKSVGVNGMLMSLLFTRTPSELRMLLIDPKMLEFGLYEGIPHLIHPVVTEPKGAAASLAWACREMDDRYSMLKRWGTRNIKGYNKLCERMAAEPKQLALEYPDVSAGEDVPKPLPYLVVVIDELADLMMVARKEVETNIARLAQKARACGIHLIVATQRPSVDVITGVIKANLPTRIAFQLRTSTDSRTVLGSGGAEALLGKGDLLYLPPGSGNIERCHGAFASDDEVHRVMDHLRAQGAPDYIAGITDDPDEAPEAVAPGERDELFDAAVEIVARAGKASTSMIQRHLKIGYNRAARIIEEMEAAGVVGPADGVRPRDVLVDPQ
jgi:S-DNA-T family DNA segregation ATPase FtsK/SpoIIIE